MPTIRSTIAAAATRATGGRQRGPSLSDTAPPIEASKDYNTTLAAIAASILYRSPLPSSEGRPIYILNSAAFPDASKVDYNSLLSYVLARLPGEEELIAGAEYELIFLAGGQPEGSTTEKKQGPDRGWYIQAYHVLGRATRKKLKKLYILHTRSWVRVLVILLSQIASRKFSRKIENVSTLSMLALHLPIEDLLLPPSAYLQDRRAAPEIYAPYVTGRRAFSARHALPRSLETGERRLPRVLRETTNFLCMPSNLRIEGLFRIPPHSTLASILKEAYDRGQQFIVWKERGATFTQPGMPRSIIDEVQLEDAYGVHLAASLIKTWYRDLREPIVQASSYQRLQDEYSPSNSEITIDQLVDLFSLGSESSPFTVMSREILIRHLIPMLALVASHEFDNKMSAEALAICFGMCLVCGPDQIQDAKMIPTIKRIVCAAIEHWPQLRPRLGLSESTFENDIAVPASFADYEDPLDGEEATEAASRHHLADDGKNRIDMQDFEDHFEEPKAEETPVLPPRRHSPPPAAANSAAESLPSFETIALVPDRKPLPSEATESTASVQEPPRYSSVFDKDGVSIDVAASPASYGPVDGFGPPRRSNFSFDTIAGEEGESKRPEETLTSPLTPSSVAAMPKRKAVTSSLQPESADHNSAKTAREAHNPIIAQIAAQQAAARLAKREPADLIVSTASTDARPTTSSGSPETEIVDESSLSAPPVFRKPSWPASGATPLAIHSLARPVQPPRKAQTMPGVPVINVPQPGPTVPLASGNPNNLMKLRGPSPGLLKRMNSMETGSDTTRPVHSSLLPQPQKLNLKKASVDDLRRLYEDRANTARSMIEGGGSLSNKSTGA